MMTDKEVMQQALEALGWTDEWRPSGLKEQAITALREALAKPDFWEGYVPEPVKPAQRWTEFNETTKRNIEHAEWYMSTHSNLAEQAPTAWILKCGEQQELWWEKPPFGEATPLYTSPPAQRTWVGLTDEEIEKLTVELRDIPVTLAFAIEAKLKEKNT